MNNLWTLLRLEFLGIWGINKLKVSHIKKDIFMALTYFFVAVVMMGYVALYCYGLASLNLTSLIPAYLIILSSVVVFFVSILKTGSVLFQRKGYETLCCLPITKWDFVCARFVRLYVENLIFVAILFFPGMIVYGLFEPVPIITTLFVMTSSALIVMLASTVIGTLIIYISSRMKHRSLVEVLLSVGVVLVILATSTIFSKVDESTLTLELLNNLSVYMYELFGKVYPLSIYFGNIILEGNLIQSMFTFAVLLVIVFLILKGVCQIYDSIMDHLYNHAQAKQKKQSFESQSLMKALIQREFKRYFSSSIYVTNTIVGPIISVALCISLFFVDIDLQPFYPFLPLMVIGSAVLMNPTAVSISMEGKQWWITKTLPITTKQCLLSKLLMSGILYTPFMVVSSICLLVLLKPTGLQTVCILLFLLGILGFSLTFGLFINMKFYQFNWENEVSVVKQSFSAFLGGMGGMFATLICALCMFLFPQINPWLFQGVTGVVTCATSTILFHKMCSVNLEVMVE